MMEKLGVWIPIIILVLIFLMKWLINDNQTIEALKRLSVDYAIDTVTLGMSFMVSYVVSLSNQIYNIQKQTPEADLSATWELFGNGLVLLFVYLILLLLVIAISKKSIELYDKSDSKYKWSWLLVGCVLSYGIAIPSIGYAMSKLLSLGGV